ncbi:glycosyl transferase family 1 [Wenxinia saemankumensis]|uniref:glycosyl transferase family 1 n=1 Tax=Wenxinia saemankumensis TaxID=1447782 RepID=UPI00111521B9|nr:glycosyl transferase family 1 [Wenxinia saemankumensis]
MRIGYLVHDLSDQAVGRRVAMFREGGATVALVGFVREGRRPPPCPDLPEGPLVLGTTRDARLIARAASVVLARLSTVHVLARRLMGAEVLVARNLEMLAIAVPVARRIGRKGGRSPRIVYECLDLHRLLTTRSVAGRALQSLERSLARHADLVLTSAPAFVVRHLGGLCAAPALVVENKVALRPGRPPAPPTPPTEPGPPFRIGWFGNLRCRRSFDLLADLARGMNGRVEVVLRGRPSPAVFPDFDARLAASPFMTFGGPYDGSRDLADLYGGVHFAWCIDFYEEGHNSAWLLPNRLYESGHHATIPIALAGTETGRFLDRNDVGLVLPDVEGDRLEAVFAGLSPERYGRLVADLTSAPRHLWTSSPDESAALVRAVSGRSGPDRPPKPRPRPGGPA